ncbi:tyrosine-type recombinase/integrase [Halocatena marina]|uniref:tyrosine-type recombinase/integrase n=1 Tax=Halocatena marina TaxID=2934937 RepID=UPI00200F34B5|nr:tyrosine-type recombinase/integrase [Halocatena marina]
MSSREPKREVEVIREQLETDERGGSDSDREALLEFSDRLSLLRETYSWHRHVKLLRHCVRMSELCPVSIAEALDDRDAAEEIVRWIHSEYDLDETPETNHSYRVAIRIFGKRLADDDEIPDSLSWISTTLPSSYDPMPDPSKMLAWDDEVQAMLEECHNPRDRAAIALQFDAGLRGGELEGLKIGDVSDTDTGLIVSVDGKTGQRSIDLIPSVPFVKRWLVEHPRRTDHTAPLWCKLSDGSEMSYRSYLKMFKEPAKRAGITKPVTPTAFRKSNACWLARQGASQTLIEDRQGRARGSDHTARYISRFGRESANRQYRKLHGIEVEETEEEDIAPHDCPRCEKPTPKHEPLCVWCGQALDPEAAKRSRDLNKFLRDALARTDDPDKIQAILEVGDLADDRADFRTQLVEQLSS